MAEGIAANPDSNQVAERCIGTPDRLEHAIREVRAALDGLHAHQPHDWTRAVKTALCKAGHGAFSGFPGRCLKIFASGVDCKVDGGEWLFDVSCLHYNAAGGGYLRWAPLIAESEWGTKQEVFDDFEKLLVARAGVRALVFDLRLNWKTMDRAAAELSRLITAFDGVDGVDVYLLAGWTPSGFEYRAFDGMAARDGALSTLA